MTLQWGILFSGQGAQKTGMGLDCYEQSNVFRQVIDASSQELQMDLSKVLRNENGELDHTRNVQPALVAVSLGLYAMLQHDLPQLDIRASVGLSLGEYSALIASGKLPFKAGMRILKARALAMERDSQAAEGKMYAIVDPQDVVQILTLCQQQCSPGQVIQIANYNSPHQIVIGGNATAAQQVAKMVQDQHLAAKVIELRVEGAFHTPLYTGTHHELARVIHEDDFVANSKCVLSNTTGKNFEADSVAKTLVDQVVQPTHFGDCLQRMIDEDQVNATLEIGAGKALTSFARQVDPQLQRERITNYRDYQRFIEKAGEKEWI